MRQLFTIRVAVPFASTPPPKELDVLSLMVQSVRVSCPEPPSSRPPPRSAEFAADGAVEQECRALVVEAAAVLYRGSRDRR